MIGAVLLAHLIGDYLFQSHWMANVKTERTARGWLAATVHGVTYAIPFAFLGSTPFDSPEATPLALAIIAGTHVVIDHYRLARHVVWLRNQFAPRAWRTEHTATGGPADGPDWLHQWLLFIADNTLHLIINVAAIWVCAR